MYRVCGTSWPLISPDRIDEVRHTFHRKASIFEEFFARFEAGGRVLWVIDANELPFRKSVLDELEPGGDSLLHFLHSPALRKLTFSLEVVAAIRPHACIIHSHHADAIGARETGDEADAFITRRDVLAVVLIHVEANEGLDAFLLHLSP